MKTTQILIFLVINLLTLLFQFYVFWYNSWMSFVIPVQSHNYYKYTSSPFLVRPRLYTRPTLLSRSSVARKLVVGHSSRRVKLAAISRASTGVPSKHWHFGGSGCLDDGWVYLARRKMVQGGAVPRAVLVVLMVGKKWCFCDFLFIFFSCVYFFSMVVFVWCG